MLSDSPGAAAASGGQASSGEGTGATPPRSASGNAKRLLGRQALPDPKRRRQGGSGGPGHAGQQPASPVLPSPSLSANSKETSPATAQGKDLEAAGTPKAEGAQTAAAEVAAGLQQPWPGCRRTVRAGPGRTPSAASPPHSPQAPSPNAAAAEAMAACFAGQGDSDSQGPPLALQSLQLASLQQQQQQPPRFTAAPEGPAAEPRAASGDGSALTDTDCDPESLPPASGGKG